MEKTKHSVVKHLIAVAVALLLFGSSGGVAWGQMYKNPRDLERAQLRAYGDTEGGVTANGEECIGNHHVKAKFIVENNYGPGESGILTPNGDNSGYWSSPSTLQGFYSGNGRITLGNTQNHVIHAVTNGNASGGLSGAQSGSATASENLTKTLCSTTKTGEYQDQYGNWVPAGSHSVTVTKSVKVDVDPIVVPDGSGRTKVGALTASDYTDETHIIVDARSKNPNQPWLIQQFYFMPNPWYGYTTDFTYPVNCSVTASFYYKRWDGYSVNHPGPPPYCTEHWYPYPTNGSLSTVTNSYKAVHWETSLSPIMGYVDAKLTVLAGSDVRLEGKDAPALSIGASAANGGGKKYDLILPAGEYTLMNDKLVDFQHITVTNKDELGKYSVFGVGEQLRNTGGISTNSAGSTILIGKTTDATSQGQMTIKASNGDAGEELGFAVRGAGPNGKVYTGTCIPKDGTANLGNYNSDENGSSPEEITVDNALNLPSTLGTGALQIFNTKDNLDMQKQVTLGVNGAGNFLIMANKQLKMNATHAITNAGDGNTNLAGGDVFLNEDGTYTGNSGKGSYGVFAYGSQNTAPIGWPVMNPVQTTNLCSMPQYSWCNDDEQNQFMKTARPSAPQLDYYPFPFVNGEDFVNNCSTFSGTGNITLASGKTSTVTLNNGHTGKARWQAINDIKTEAGSTVAWTNNTQGDMWWMTGRDILPQATITWKKSASSSNQSYWQAKRNIAVTENLTANWEADAGAVGAMRWLAGRDISFASGKTVQANWVTKGATNMLWEAGHDIVSVNANLTADWKIDSNASGDLRWNASDSIKIINPTSIQWSSAAGSTGNMEWASGFTIKADNNAGTFTFKQEGKTGYTRWHAGQDIDAGGKKTFTNASTQGGIMIWKALRDIITTDGGGTPPQLVRFERTTDAAGLMAWQSGHEIRTGSKIEFENMNAAANNKANMEWYACNSILTNYGATGADASDHHSVSFTNYGKGDMIWHANADNIETRSKTMFTNKNDGNMTWYAGSNIHTRLGTNEPSSQLTEGVIFKQEGTGRTVWWANDGNIETYNPVHFNWLNALSDATSIVWWAGTDIEIGNNFDPNHPLQSHAKFETAKNDTILLKTRDGHILTNSQVDIERSNNGAALTKLWAGCQQYKLRNNIDIENVFNYTEKTNGQAAGALVHLYAENDIISNKECDNNRPAPITFTLLPTSKTITKWEAERNINTMGRVDFLYGDATNAGPLTWLSRAGYIQTERPVTIAYKSDSTISILAEDWRHDKWSRNDVVTNANASGRRGNIHFFDSVDIKRDNQNGGLTQIKAENHIWTAMVNYVDKQSTGDTMDIISHKGDIYLGYNDGGTKDFDWKYYVANTQGWNITQKAPSAGCDYPKLSTVDYNLNRFTYNIPASNTKGHLWIKAGWEEKTDRNAVPDNGKRSDGGNIYFTHIDVMQATGSNHPTVISIPFSGLWRCGAPGDSLLHSRPEESMQYYENAGIISGVNHCLRPYPSSGNIHAAEDRGLVYRGAKGDLTVDAGNRGNIIFNKGAYVSFQDPSSTGNSVFRTRFGDIDMRDPFNVDTIHGSMLFLAQRDNLSDLSKTGICGCDEERNNVYLQDFQYLAHEASGSIFVGADNNIKLNYGGLQNMGTRHDPFLSKYFKKCKEGYGAKWGEGYLNGGGCGEAYHCDAVESENQARPLVLNFEKDGGGKAITKGGFAAVASDYIDVYKKMQYRGGRGSGMGSVPTTGTLHGENVVGYGLFMKTQANKNNWTINIFNEIPKCPTTCAGDNCDRDYLHMVSRMTFHDDADIQAQNQKVMLWSPVIETYGLMTLDTKTNSGNNTEITLKADSLIFHDDFVKIGNKTKLSTWSGLKNDKPIMKFGHMRHKPPFLELKYDDCADTTHCAPCHYYIRGSKDPLHMMDTITIKFGDDAYLERLNTVVFDHTVLTCLTDSFDHIKGAPVLNAQIRTDTLKIRNQVDLFADKNHERDAHLELISERQMGSKDYAGIYTKHLHMEPIGACGTPYSELWTSDDLALDVITTSIFGGFGFIHSDVHVENGAHLNAGFTSLRLRGLCYEQLCGTQRMKDLRLDVGAQLHFSVGTKKGLNGEYSDAIEVEKLTTYGSVDVNIEVRPCEKMEKRCYPIIYYKSLTPNSLNNLKVKPAVVKIDGEEYPLHLNIGTDGIVYVCVGDAQPVDLTRTVTIPSVTGVTTDPAPGIWEVKSRGNFKFKATFSGTKPLAVRTSRMVNGAPEMLTGKKNANGEYEYVIPHVQEDVTLTIGPDFVANELLAGTAVWSHGEMIYIRVDRADIASIYSVAGQLVRKIDLPEGDTSIPMSRGAYVITLKDGSVHKVIVK